MHLTDYRVRVLDTGRGTGAATRVLVDTTDGERTWTTIGVSENIIEASWQALFESIVYGIRRRRHEEGKRADRDVGNVRGAHDPAAFVPIPEADQVRVRPAIRGRQRRVGRPSGPPSCVRRSAPPAAGSGHPDPTRGFAVAPHPGGSNRRWSGCRASPIDDVMVGCALLASRRPDRSAGRRAPRRCRVALGLFGFLAPPQAATIEARVPLFRSAAREYYVPSAGSSTQSPRRSSGRRPRTCPVPSGEDG